MEHSAKTAHSKASAAFAFLLVVWFLMSAPAALAHDDGGAFHMEHHCLAQEVCMFEAANYDHGYYGTAGDLLNYWWLNYEDTDDGHVHRLNDTASSIDNDGGNCGSRHFIDANHQGGNFWLPQGNSIAALAGSNNALSSHRWCS